MSAVPKFGLAECGKCDKGRKAYYFSADGLTGVCGYCAPKKLHRKKLPRDEEAEAVERLAHRRTVDEAAKANRAAGRRGDLRCAKMFMMSKVKMTEGYLAVFPNFKHGSRKDGLGLSALSPKAIGPVHHGQPGLPPAMSLENFHQGSKWFRGKTREEFEAMRLEMYRNPTPLRHNPHANPKAKNRNIPKCFVWVGKDGTPHEIDYVTSRQFYCNFYTQAVTQSAEFAQLEAMLAKGYNITLHGYDGYQPDDDTPEALEQHYLDPSRPFGHELVLYTLLKYPPEHWPWRKHSQLYDATKSED